MNRNQIAEKRKPTSVSDLCRRWKQYQHDTWSSATDQQADMQDMGVIVSTRTIRQWRSSGALPEKYAWALIVKLGWPFLIAVMGDSLAESYQLMEDGYARRQDENRRSGEALLSLMHRNTDNPSRVDPLDH